MNRRRSQIRENDSTGLTGLVCKWLWFIEAERSVSNPVPRVSWPPFIEGEASNEKSRHTRGRVADVKNVKPLLDQVIRVIQIW